MGVTLDGNAVKQVYTVVNAVAQQVMGSEAITVTDTGSFVSLAQAVTSSKVYTEAFLNTIPDVLALTIIDSRAYLSTASAMIKHAFEFGTYVRKIKVFMPEAEVNTQWQIGQDGFTPVPYPVIKSDVRVKVISGFATWQMGVTIPDYVLRTAFQSASEMAIFINAVFVALENSMQMAVENLSDLTRANFIGWKLHNANPCGAINLLTSYNTLTNRSLTTATCLMDEEFLAWATSQMLNWSRRLERMSTLFNDEDYQRHTPKEYQVCEILQDFEAYVNTFLKRPSFNANLVELPNYTTVPYWQGSGTTYAWDDISSINLQLKAAEGEETAITVEQSGIIGVLYDMEALGMTINERDTTSERNNRSKYTDYWADANMGYFNDLSENGIVFYIAES